jgi:hypothetical protein
VQLRRRRRSAARVSSFLILLRLVSVGSKVIQFLSRKSVKRIARWVIPYLVKKFKRAYSRRNKISRRRSER